MALLRVSQGRGAWGGGLFDLRGREGDSPSAIQEGLTDVPIWSPGLLVLKELGIEIERYVASEIDPDSVKVGVEEGWGKVNV